MYQKRALNELVARTGHEPLNLAYKSRFQRWNEKASVRLRPAQVLDFQLAQWFFPPELLPEFTHPLVVERGRDAQRKLLTHRLYSYLNFTTELEQLAIIPVTMQISRDRSGLDLPPKMRSDAFKIVTDEAWHAQFCYEMMSQVTQATGVAPKLPAVPQFVARLDTIRDGLPAQVRGVEELLFAVVSETLISTILSDIPRHAQLPVAVREIVRDHAEDEGRHHAYFHSILERLWPALSHQDRRQLGPVLPSIIFAFLEPDYAALSAALAELGLTSEAVHQVLQESYPLDQVSGSTAAAAATTIRYFRQLGALDDAETEDAFAEAALIPPRGAQIVE